MKYHRIRGFIICAAVLFVTLIIILASGARTLATEKFRK